jgi:hypothetical protein
MKMTTILQISFKLKTVIILNMVVYICSPSMLETEVGVFEAKLGNRARLSQQQKTDNNKISPAGWHMSIILAALEAEIERMAV